MSKMKILITGSNGQLGRELMEEFERRSPGIAVGADHSQLDITDARKVKEYLTIGDFTHVVNCAAYTAVDHAEEEKLQCQAVNMQGIANIAQHADALGIRILHISTDYVFDGKACRPYDESAKPNPLSVYGTTKRKGETALLALAPSAIIVRTGWLYSPYGHNFVSAILEKARSGAPLRVVADQTGTPTCAADLASAIADIILSDKWTPGIYHYANEGVASRYDFAVAILEAAGMPEKAALVQPALTADYPTRADRPPFVVLDKSRIKATFRIKIPHWQASLRRCIARFK